MKLTLGYFYPELLNLYGDNGNVEILVSRARARDIFVDVIKVGLDTRIDSTYMSQFDVVFMGGGPDSAQKSMYLDLLNKKGRYLKEYIELGGVGLYICGSYQLLGKYYKSADGTQLDGLGVLDLYTQHFGNHKPRCIGNVVCEIHPNLSQNPLFRSVNNIGSTLVGFENHGGRTFLSEGMYPFATVVKGFGNNGEDKTEGIFYKNTIGTYMHGPLLSKNPHIADFLIAKSLDIAQLPKLDDDLIITAHTASLDLH